MEQKSAVAEWFKRKSILITGGTGFMGKVLIEKLLFSCNEIDTIYIMTRQKLKSPITEKLKDMWELPVFNRLSIAKPDFLKQIVLVSADLSLDSLGLTQRDKQKLIDNVSVVFHLASTDSLQSELKEAIDVNVSGTQKLLELCRDMKNPVTFIHTSTIFCSSDVDVFEEKEYETSADVERVINMVKWINVEALTSITPEMIVPHPNTYFYSKRLAESVISEATSIVRVAIIRPSIVCPAIAEPLVGWADTFHGPMGIISAYATGILRTMYGISDCDAHFIPVDVAVHTAIVAAWKLGSAITQLMN
ncbi:male sterility protein 2-related [Holotrichia oblita]|uniref:Male sterility protein 2-related n=1 Tax=Holotrichia oblita TaxID=644536 RepID=A0ACB9TU58_HOLOL|nr:male sterility protein 2-related [Holotrichia oblita]